jgi:hypothetical protein
MLECSRLLSNHFPILDTAQAALEGRTSNAIWLRGLLLTAQSVSSSIRRFATDYDGVFVDDVKITGSPDVRGSTSRSRLSN